MVKRNIPDWQRSAFDKDNNSCVKTKPFGKRIKEFEVANAKAMKILICLFFYQKKSQ